MAYTYDNFVEAANAAGMMDKFGEDDLKIAQSNPEYGLSMLSLQKDLAGATTEEQKLLATEAANQLRKSYSGMQGGYQSSYGQQIKDRLDALGTPNSFAYDAQTDPVYNAYQKAYLREGQRATADAIGQASAASAGRPSSYAVTAGAQAGNYYAGKLADTIPTLEQNAYQRYLNNIQTDMSRLEALQAQEKTDYERYLNEVSIQQQEFDNALKMYQLLGDQAPAKYLEALGIPVPVASAGGGGGGGRELTGIPALDWGAAQTDKEKDNGPVSKEQMWDNVATLRDAGVPISDIMGYTVDWAKDMLG